ncbi:MAG: GNAT family N-acetyltransferase [candidate division Zixibacteria bacterium]|nr:GNAT family N-acetyltransferase [candidate division Zixibacteria bacterium]
MNILIRKLKQDDYTSVARFIAELNSSDSNNICDLGTKAVEIEHFIHHDLLDMKAEDGFILAHDNNELVGVFGLDIDLDKNRAYLLGPYIKHDNWREVADILWAAILKILPKSVAQARLGPNSKNINCIEFAESNGFDRGNDGLVLKLERQAFQPHKSPEIVEISQNQQDAFIKLHEMLFPKSYYNGRDILSRCNQNRVVFVDREVKGYVYVETQPEFGESNIEFIGVHPSQQGKGLGGKLLNRAIQWIFSFETIEAITLSTYADNPARWLYEKAGFQVEDIVLSYSKDFQR